MTSNKTALVLAAMIDHRLDELLARLPAERRSRPWSLSIGQRVLVSTTTAKLAASADIPANTCNAQSLISRRDLRIIATAAGGLGIETIRARLPKNWRILRGHRRCGRHLAKTINGVAFLHNLHIDELRDNL